MALERYKSSELIGKQYGVSRANVQRWEKAGAPTQSEKYLAEWLLTRTGLKECVRTEAERITGKKRLPISAPAMPMSLDAAESAAQEVETAFHAMAGGRKVTGDIAESNSSLAKFRDFAAGMLQRAIDTDDRAELEYWGKQYRAFEKTHQEGLLLAKKLGIDNGELMRKEDAEKYLRAVAYWLVRCVDGAKRRLREHVADDAGEVIDAALLPAVLVQPLMRAVKMGGPTELPQWAVETITDAIDDYVEAGREEAQKELSSQASETVEGE